MSKNIFHKNLIFGTQKKKKKKKTLNTTTTIYLLEMLIPYKVSQFLLQLAIYHVAGLAKIVKTFCGLFRSVSGPSNLGTSHFQP